MLDRNITNPKTVHSEQYGELIEADCFVRQDYEPRDQPTQLYLEDLLQEMGLVHGDTRPSSCKKYIRALSDFMMCAKTSVTGYIAWPCSSDDFVGAPYGADVSRNVRNALIGSGYLQLVQKSSKRDALASVYTYDPSIVPPWVSFKCHGEGCPVQVRSKKTLDPETGRKVGGQRLSRKKFLPQIVHLEEQVNRINSVLVQHPLEDCFGRLYARCYRVYNNGALTQGGRLYGPWQSIGEDERLASTIGGDPVCEIDFKASFVSIANAILGPGDDLGEDPYQHIRFVRQTNGELREAAKRLVAAYICNGGKISRFPRGKTKRDPLTGEVRPVSFKEEYNLKGVVAEYMEDIFQAFPFLRHVSKCQYDFMYMESEIVVSSIVDLTSGGIPAYPVHDCLLVRIQDRDKAIEVLQHQMVRHLGTIIDLDISYLNDLNDKIIDQVRRPEGLMSHMEPVFRKLSYNWNIDEDVDLLDDEDRW